jgi:hypothetical protein
MMDWASDMHLISAGSNAEVDAYVGYFEPYATSRQALDREREADGRLAEEQFWRSRVTFSAERRVRNNSMEAKMPVILWLLGVPVVVVIALMLTHVI